MADEEKAKKPAEPAGDKPPAKPPAKRPAKRDAAGAKAQREAEARQAAEEAEAAASEETEEEEDAIEGTDSPDETDEGEEADGADDEEGAIEEKEEEAPARRRRGGRRRSRKSTDDEEDEEEAAERKRPPRPRPSLSADVKLALEQRKEISARRPEFRRQEWFRYQRLGDAWRAPQGIQSKQRRHWKNHPDLVSIGFRGPKKARGLHPSGFREVLVENEKGLSGVDRKTEAVRIASSVGGRKRDAIQRRARKMGIRVLNWR